VKTELVIIPCCWGRKAGEPAKSGRNYEAEELVAFTVEHSMLLFSLKNWV
jgi:hypothetical protein